MKLIYIRLLFGAIVLIGAACDGARPACFGVKVGTAYEVTVVGTTTPTAPETEWLCPTPVGIDVGTTFDATVPALLLHDQNGGCSAGRAELPDLAGWKWKQVAGAYYYSECLLAGIYDVSNAGCGGLATLCIYPHDSSQGMPDAASGQYTAGVLSMHYDPKSASPGSTCPSKCVVDYVVGYRETTGNGQ